jgi:hypothetical protein
MTIDLEHIRSQNPIEDVINEKFSLKKSSSRFIGTEHDSMVVTPKNSLYFWNSRGEHGDVFDFVGRHMLSYGDGWNNRNSNQFMEAVRYLAKRAGITLEVNADFKKSPAWAERQLVQRLHDALLNHPSALAYTTETRGWQLSNVKASRLGYMPQDKAPLLAELNLSDSWRSVVHKFPSGMLIYIHMEKGRLVYLSGRSIEGKRHYNPPRDIIGERHPYFNHSYSKDADQIVLVEGQADAVTFAEWDIPAIAVAGTHVSDELIERLNKHRRVFVALDNVPETAAKTAEICRALGAVACVPKLPNDIKDANEWLTKVKANRSHVDEFLNEATPWLEAEILRVGNITGLMREDGIRELLGYTSGLDEFGMARFKDQMAKIGIKGRMFNDLLKAAKDENGEDDNDDDTPQILGDDVPLLSPALGFRRDAALVTVSMIERTKDYKLNIQPYLVTSQRELHRLDDKQIMTLNGKEIALRVIPEGSEFLMRWKHSDIQRFLQGETASPEEVFNTVHDLFTRYVDFKSPADAKVLTLWVIGTYFYTMFPAYPYLALNGPKNSGKSTVLRVAQPLAFNMVNTSDPTGPSMFRLIHTTSCTVGIDEAERYHNPRDPAMQQIRQLLNSGYKQGMPAIRLIGEDMKPQAFDVYSPKILAAIAGLEDVLASRCIAVPMRRTDHKMPSFPSDFEGASIRHQLYTLALTSHEPVYRNYFERPELHKLQNRSAELWSPLLALAAFFEEDGNVSGLLQSLTDAAANADVLQAGQALSEREESVLQALEIITQGKSSTTWIKASALREQVAKLMGQSHEDMGHAQWIGHILKRLHLLDDARRKRSTEGMAYAIDLADVQDMMRRYDVDSICKTDS